MEKRQIITMHKTENQEVCTNYKGITLHTVTENNIKQTLKRNNLASSIGDRRCKHNKANQKMN